MGAWSKPSRARRELRDLAALARARLARAASGPAPLRNLTLARTLLCNAGCAMCDIWRLRESEPPGPELTLDEIETLARAKYLRRLVSLNLTGGEPFLRADLGDVIARFERHTALEYTSLVTNGYQTEVILRTAADILAKSEREVWIHVSVDAGDERHDVFRGMTGARERCDATLRGLADLRASAPRLGLGILFTLLPRNLDQLVPVFEYARGLGVQFTVSVCNDGPVYYRRSHGETRAWYRERLDDILAEFQRLADAGLDDTFSLALRRLFPVYLVDNSVPVVPCYSGTTSAYVDPYGNVYSCVAAGPWQAFGNVRRTPFDALWEAERARWIRGRIAAGSCKCLIPCETSNALKFNSRYLLLRALRRAGVDLPGAPYVDRRSLVAESV